MGILPPNLPPITPGESATVRRVDPKSGLKDFGEKDRPASEAHEHEAEDEEGAPHDAVDLSDEYRLTAHAEAAEGSDQSPVHDGGDGSGLRHLDIEV